MTKLNDNQIEILKKARANLSYYSHDPRYVYMFICHQVIFADMGSKEFPKGVSLMDLASQCSPDAQDLLEAIQNAIKGSISLELYVARHVKGDCYAKFSTLARLAWLDKMIDSGVCA